MWLSAQETTIHIDQDQFDYWADTENSNQAILRSHQFKMRVTRVVHHRLRIPGKPDQERITAIGLRYKSDGTFTKSEARAEITEANIPERVLAELLDMLGRI
jgi:hypothetical protein